ncbi:hypothetical protein [Trueperella bialowiezensis]|uniref:Uncharacterized protein n=1 Tax=Trueperella bialowiezensis TaxID=312285 RepID=A0A3S4V6P2_9ACTO|nr:hypothetical protein [Trueperella bialowiezensis]VEI13192.1 Uncharacterised protein [Trueperella bialowiezensis]
MSSIRAWRAVVVGVVVALVATLVLPMLRDYDPQPIPADNGKVVVLGMAGVPWEAVDERTPHLQQLSTGAVLANVSVRTFGMTTCPAAGWITLNTGVRTAGIDGDAEPCAQYGQGMLPQPATERLAIWDDVRVANSANRFTPQFGQLAETVTGQGKTVAAVGPGGALAIADSAGIPAGPVVHPPMNGPVSEGAARAYRQVKDADLVVVDLGSAHRDSAPASQLEMTFIPPGPVSTQTRALAARIDAEIGALMHEIEPGTTLIITSLADADRQTARLQLYLQFVAGDDGAGDAPGSGDVEGNAGDAQGGNWLATSASTRQAGIIQNVDVPHAVFAALGVDAPRGGAGAPVSALDAGYAGPTTLADTNERAIMTRAMVGLFYVLYVVGALVILAGVAIMIRGHRFGPHHAFALLVSSSLPAASFLVNLLPWWRAGRFSALTYTGLVTAIALVIAFASLKIAAGNNRVDEIAGRRRILAPGFIALTTAVTLGVDSMLGAPLHSISVLGDQPQSGGRFYGMSNAPFAVWAVSMILLAVIAVNIVKQHRARVAVPGVVLAIAFIAIYVDGAPHIGADFGGPPALVLGFGVFLLLVIGVRLTATRIGVLVAAAAVGTLAISFADWLRPPTARTHLGRFFDSLLNGEALTIVARKADQLITQVPWYGWLAAICAVIFLWLLWRRADLSIVRHNDDVPELRAGAIAVVVTLLSAMLINDSGLVIPLIGGLYGMCLWAIAAIPATPEAHWTNRKN